MPRVRGIVFTGSGSPTFSGRLDADKQLFNTALRSQAGLLLQPELQKHQRHIIGNRFLAGGKFSKWRLGRTSDAKDVSNGFPKEIYGEMYLLKRVEVGAKERLNKARGRTLYTKLRRRDELNRYGRMVIRGGNGEAFITKSRKGEKHYMRREVGNPYKRAMKVTGGTLEMREEEEENDVKHVRVMKGLDNKTLYPRPLTRVMKRGEDEDDEGGKYDRVVRSTGQGKKYTRVIKEEDGDDVDAQLVKRKGEEEYVLVMRRAKDTNSNATIGDLDAEISTRVMTRNPNWRERFLRTTRKQDNYVDFTKDLFTRMG